MNSALKEFDPVTALVVRRHPWEAAQILEEALWEDVGDQKRSNRARFTLYHDMVSEYDSLLFDQYIRSLQIPFSPEFFLAETLWLQDENNHFSGLVIANQGIFGLDKDEIEKVHERQPNFDPIKHLLTDEFSILLTAAYDEIVTVFGYKEDLPMYDGFGPQFGRFIRRVIVDEGWHYSKFLDLLRKYHSFRFGEAGKKIQMIREAEGLPYQATFLMDHILDEIYTPEIFDRSAQILLKNLGMS